MITNLQDICNLSTLCLNNVLLRKKQYKKTAKIDFCAEKKYTFKN